nr:MAG TPA: hypothetical protein [Caudoviricetes sp.]
MALCSGVDPITHNQLLKGQVLSYDNRISLYPGLPDQCFQYVIATLTYTPIPLSERLAAGFDTYNAKYTF